jgi:hypothetical protein
MKFTARFDNESRRGRRVRHLFAPVRFTIDGVAHHPLAATNLTRLDDLLREARRIDRGHGTGRGELAFAETFGTRGFDFGLHLFTYAIDPTLRALTSQKQASRKNVRNCSALAPGGRTTERPRLVKLLFCRAHAA